MYYGAALGAARQNQEKVSFWPWWLENKRG
jgi:hypothetical protein